MTAAGRSSAPPMTPSSNPSPRPKRRFVLVKGHGPVRQKESTLPPCGVLVVESRNRLAGIGSLEVKQSMFCLVIGGHAHWESSGRRYPLGPDTLCHITS